MSFEDKPGEGTKVNWAEELERERGARVTDMSIPIIQCVACDAEWEVERGSDGEFVKSYWVCENGCNS